MAEFQSVRQKKVKRTQHVFRFLRGGLVTQDTWKCVLCGWTTTRPGEDEAPGTYEKLSDDERGMCPPSGVRNPAAC